jgi:hypothetical protein
MAALYVDPKDRSWNRPVLTTRVEARDFLYAAINAYAREYYRTTHPFSPPEIEIFEALSKWLERPELWRPEWPGLTH